MAFRINTILEGYEFRGIKTGTSSAGNPWVSLILEDENAEQCDVSVPSEFQGAVLGMGLTKGDYISCRVLACSTANYSFLRLLEMPAIAGNGALATSDGLGY